MILKGGSTRDTKSKLKLKKKEYKWRRMMNVLNPMKIDYENIVDDDFDFLFKAKRGEGEGKNFPQFSCFTLP